MWIEILYGLFFTEPLPSSFVWRMWIEIRARCIEHWQNWVILRVKDVDWNLAHAGYYACRCVILRVKDVDWNKCRHDSSDGASRHPSCEGCGLKCIRRHIRWRRTESSFVWRMWIEIITHAITHIVGLSSFVWRMWIEMAVSLSNSNSAKVILRVKDVDWNAKGKVASPPKKVILRVKDVDWNSGLYTSTLT